ICEGSEATCQGSESCGEQTEEAGVRALLEATRKKLVHSEDNTKEMEREFKVPPRPSPPLPSPQVPLVAPCLLRACLLSGVSAEADAEAGVAGFLSLRPGASLFPARGGVIGWYRISRQTWMSRLSTACSC
ncbi:MAG: hypothetical protein ACK55Z_04165, partial [bacterium]